MLKFNKYKTKIYLEQVDISEKLKQRYRTIPIENILKRQYTKDRQKTASQIVYTLEIQNSPNVNVYIDSFDTFSPYKHQGYGTKLLNKTAKQILKFKRKYKFNIIKIYGQVVPMNHRYWQYSIPMYHKFAQKIFKNQVMCKIDNEIVNENNLLTFIQNLSKTSNVGFEFYSKKEQR